MTDRRDNVWEQDVPQAPPESTQGAPPEPPTYPMPDDAVDVEAGRAQLDRIVDEFTEGVLAPLRTGIDLNRPIVICLNVTPGLGKTTAVLERLVPPAVRAGKVVYIFVPRHALGRQQRDFLAATGIDSRVYQSRGSDNIEKPGQFMCLETDRVEAIHDALGDVSNLACKNSKGDRCKLFDDCDYQRQLRDPLPRVWFIPQQNISQPLPSRIPKPDIVVIDERFHGACEEDDVILEINDIVDNRAWPKGKKPTIEDEADLRATAQKVYLILHEQLSRQARCRVRRDWFVGAISAKDAKEAHRLEWARKLPIDDVHPGMDRDLAIKRAKLRQSHNQTVKRLCKFWEKLALTLEHDWEFSLYLSIDRDCAIPFSERSAPAVVIASRMEMHENIARCPTLHLDGTMVPLIVQQFYPHATFHEIAVKMPLSTTFVQETDRTISKSSNSELIIEQCRQLVETEAKSTNGLVGVITLTHIERELQKSNPPLPGNVKIWHYGNTTGLNDFSDASTIILIGRQEPRPIDVEKQARLLFRREVLEVPRYYPKKPRRIALRGGGTVTVEGTYHPDPGVEALRWTGCEGEAMQALHRGRPINRTADNPLKVIVATNVCLPIEIDHAMLWDEMRPLLFEAVLARGDAFPMSYADLAAAYPAMFPSRDAASMAFDRERKTRNESLKVSLKRFVTGFGVALVLTKTAGSYRKTLRVFEAQYRRAGARGPATILLFDFVRADPAAWLRGRLIDAILIKPTGDNE